MSQNQDTQYHASQESQLGAEMDGMVTCMISSGVSPFDIEAAVK